MEGGGPEKQGRGGFPGGPYWAMVAVTLNLEEILFWTVIDLETTTTRDSKN